MNVVHESYGPLFDKWHLNPKHDPSPEFPSDCHPTIHRLHPDEGTPHDHPFSFHSFILDGWYEEEIFRQTPSGKWYSYIVRREKGLSHFADSSIIHRVIRTSEGGCMTCVLYGEDEREWRYYPEALNDQVGTD